MRWLIVALVGACGGGGGGGGAGTTDADGDGFAAAQDCDDLDPDVNPDAEEIPYDGRDNDCSPTTPDDDLDGDGAALAADCDDANAAVHPGATEVCGDGVDNDCAQDDTCDHVGDVPLSEAPAATGEAAFDHAGFSVASAGDVDGDGNADLVIGAPDHDGGASNSGAAYLLRGPILADPTLDTVTQLIGEGIDDFAGYSVAGVGDATGDGLADIIVGAPGGGGRGVAYLVPGPVAAGALGGTGLQLIGEGIDDFAAAALSGPGELGGDGRSDFVIGAPQAAAGGTERGAAFVFLGAPPGSGSLASASVVLEGVADQDHAGGSVAVAADLDGDGIDEVVVGAHLVDGAGSARGAAYVMASPLTGIVSLGSHLARFDGVADADYAGWDVASAGDANGDGFGDLIVGAPYSDRAVADGGVAYLLLGPHVGQISLDLAAATIQGANAGALAGYSVCGLDDRDGDGGDELLIGAPGDDLGGVGAGAAFVWSGATLGVVDARGGLASLIGEGIDDFTGQSVANLGSLDGVGGVDLGVGAPNASQGGQESGAVYLLLGDGVE